MKQIIHQMFQFSLVYMKKAREFLFQEKYQEFRVRIIVVHRTNDEKSILWIKIKLKDFKV